MKEGIIPFERFILEEFKKSFFTGKSKDKSVCFKLIELLIEREFVNSTIQKKFPNFSKLEPKKKKAIKLKMIKDLIHRDKKDLNLYEENSVLFSLKNKNNNIIDKKINSQKTKIEIKLTILVWIEENIFLKIFLKIFFYAKKYLILKNVRVRVNDNNLYLRIIEKNRN